MFLAESRLPDGGAYAITMTQPRLNARPERRLGALWGAAWQAVPPAVTRSLAEGGAALEIGCGSGLACLALAEAIPGAQVTGHDSDAAAIERARDLAQAAGLGTRVAFAVDDSTRLARASFQLITAEGLRERSADPGRVLNAVRNALAPDGACLLLEGPSARLASADLETLARQAGFSRVRLVSSGSLRLCELRR
jgi:SAM-dependent methyltransferase